MLMVRLPTTGLQNIIAKKIKISNFKHSSKDDSINDRNNTVCLTAVYKMVLKVFTEILNNYSFLGLFFECTRTL